MVTEATTMLIGIEEHFLTPAIERAWHAIGLEAADPSVGYRQGTFGRRLVDLGQGR
jgi:hypothetical protein